MIRLYNSNYEGRIYTYLLFHRPEAAIALRQRLNEVVEQLDTLRVEHNQLLVNFETQSRELTIAKSDRK